MWDSIRQEYQPLITDIQKSIDEQLEQWGRTGSEEHLLFAQHQINHLKEIKDHVCRLENQARKY